MTCIETHQELATYYSWQTTKHEMWSYLMVRSMTQSLVQKTTSDTLSLYETVGGVLTVKSPEAENPLHWVKSRKFHCYQGLKAKHKWANRLFRFHSDWTNSGNIILQLQEIKLFPIWSCQKFKFWPEDITFLAKKKNANRFYSIMKKYNKWQCIYDKQTQNKCYYFVYSPRWIPFSWSRSCNATLLCPSAHLIFNTHHIRDIHISQLSILLLKCMQQWKQSAVTG